MVRYLIKRLLLIVPTLLVISLLTFFISTNTPGDPVNLQGQHEESFGNNSWQSRQAYQRKRSALGLDKPLFYFSFSRLSLPDTLHRISISQHRNWLTDIAVSTGNWPLTQQWYLTFRQLDNKVQRLAGRSDRQQVIITLTERLFDLYQETDLGALAKGLEELNHLVNADTTLSPLKSYLLEAKESLDQLQQQSTPWRSYVPAFYWHGIDNQYHRWLAGGEGKRGLFQGNLGYSYRNQNAVTAEISAAVGHTLTLSIIAIILAYSIAIPLGVFSAAQKDSRWDRGIQTTLFLLYSLPVFWIGTLLIIFLGGGDFLQWFPPYGLGNTRGLSIWQAFWVRVHHLVLPLLCLVYPTLAFLSRQARGSMVQSLHEDYIRTARSKGLPERAVIWRHGFRNALLPLLTLLANVFPFAVAGSVIVEVVFSIPGMGKLTLEALYARDYPVVYGVVMLIAVMTTLGYWISDALYSLADPRIRWKNSTA